MSAADGVDHVGERLVLGEHLQPAGHRGDRHVGARDEGEREDDHSHALRGLAGAGEQAHRHEQPLEGEAEDDHEPERREPVEDAAVEAEADREGDRDRDRGGEREDGGVGDRAGGEHGAARDRQRAQPVDEPLLEVLGGGDGGPDPGEEHPGGDEAGDEVVDVGDRAGVDRAAEHVAVDEEEQGHLQRGHHDQLRRPQVAKGRSAGDGQRARDESRRDAFVAAVEAVGDGCHGMGRPFSVQAAAASARGDRLCRRRLRGAR